jgi:hypothetical protein
MGAAQPYSQDPKPAVDEGLTRLGVHATNRL